MYLIECVRGFFLIKSDKFCLNVWYNKAIFVVITNFYFSTCSCFLTRHFFVFFLFPFVPSVSSHLFLYLIFSHFNHEVPRTGFIWIYSAVVCSAFWSIYWFLKICDHFLLKYFLYPILPLLSFMDSKYLLVDPFTMIHVSLYIFLIFYSFISLCFKLDIFFWATFQFTASLFRAI